MKIEENINLKEFRKSLNLNKIQMSKRIGVSNSYYYKVESGTLNASFGFMQKFKSEFPKASIDKIFFQKK